MSTAAPPDPFQQILDGIGILKQQATDNAAALAQNADTINSLRTQLQQQGATDATALANLKANDATILAAVQGNLDSASAWLDNPNVQVLDNLQAMPDWILPKGNVGDTGGGNNQAAGHFDIAIGTLGAAPTPMLLKWNPAHAYNGGYAFRNCRELFTPNLKRFRYDLLWTYQSDADMKASQAFEFELEHCVAGEVWNAAWQFNLAGHAWRTFFYNPPPEYKDDKWQPTAIPFDPSLVAGGKYMAVSSEFVKIDHIGMIHVALIVNGVRYPLWRAYPSQPGRWGSGSNYLHAAVQLDAKGGATPAAYTVKLARAQVRVL